MFFRRKRAKSGDDTTQQQSVGQGQGEGSRGGGRPCRLATTKEPTIEDITSYEESDSEGAYQPASHETHEASQETRFMEEDEDDEESSSPGERPLPGGRDVSNIPVNEWTQPEYWAFREQNPYVAATELGADPRFRNVF